MSLDENSPEVERALTTFYRRSLELETEKRTQLRSALEKIVDESPPDTAYSWCQTHLARCHQIARDALGAEHQSQTEIDGAAMRRQQYDALCGLLGLIQLLLGRDDMPQAIRDAIHENHRYHTAIEVAGRIADKRGG